MPASRRALRRAVVALAVILHRALVPRAAPLVAALLLAPALLDNRLH